MSSLGNKIRAFRKERGVTLTQLATKLELSPSYLSLIERDIKKPSLIQLKKISSYLNISLSYLTTTPAADSFLSEKLRSIREGRGLSLEDLAELSEVPVAEIKNIEESNSKPSLEYLEKISTALNVSPQYFVDRTLFGVKIGDKIKARRENLELSQVELANLAKISPALISQIENNVTIPSLETLDTISESLRVSTSFFLIDSEQTTEYLSNLSPELITLLGDIKVQSILNAVRDLEPGELNFILNFIEFFKLNRKILS